MQRAKCCDKIELAEKDYFGFRYIDEKDGQANGNISQFSQKELTNSNLLVIIMQGGYLCQDVFSFFVFVFFFGFKNRPELKP